MNVFELNLDGLVGPTHHYAGLSSGNLASMDNALKPANPQAAARQGLKKMRFLHDLGFKQGILPPHQRPNLSLLRQLGFTGSPAQQVIKASQVAPELLSACYSASSMWTANAATVSPSMDSHDHKVHFTTANLVSNLHRHQEADFSKTLLETVFSHENYFCHHPILPRSSITADEGAANHNRLCARHSEPGIQLFVYGKKALGHPLNGPAPRHYPARQTKEASEAIARNHLLDPKRVVFACQNPAAIDQGVFHNDVISVANESVYLIHQDALFNQKEVLNELTKKADFCFNFIEIKTEELTVTEAVRSYLFNSQLITIPESNQMILVAPTECQDNPRVNTCIARILDENTNPIKEVYYFDLKQSMRNGGGPACLRLRVPLNTTEMKIMHQGVLITPDLLNALDQWVLKHYRTALVASDLADPLLINEVLYALDELSQILKLGNIYPFQAS